MIYGRHTKTIIKIIKTDWLYTYKNTSIGNNSERIKYMREQFGGTEIIEIRRVRIIIKIKGKDVEHL